MRRPWVALAIPLLALVACGDDPPADERAFCERLERLSDNDPFAAFGARATNREIQLAFTALVARSKELVAAAPDEVQPTARDYADAAKALDDLLAAAAYDADEVDARAYRDEQIAYTGAAARLERYLESCRGGTATGEG